MYIIFTRTDIWLIANVCFSLRLFSFIGDISFQFTTHLISCGGGPVGSGLGTFVCLPFFFALMAVVVVDVDGWRWCVDDRMKEVDSWTKVVATSSKAARSDDGNWFILFVRLCWLIRLDDMFRDEQLLMVVLCFVGLKGGRSVLIPTVPYVGRNWN